MGGTVLRTIVDRRTITLIWVGGGALMLAVYTIGPEHFIATCAQFIDDAMTWLSNLVMDSINAC